MLSKGLTCSYKNIMLGPGIEYLDVPRTFKQNSAT